MEFEDKKALSKIRLEQAEDEYDIAIAEHEYNNYINSGRKSRPINELWQELDL